MKINLKWGYKAIVVITNRCGHRTYQWYFLKDLPQFIMRRIKRWVE